MTQRVIVWFGAFVFAALVILGAIGAVSYFVGQAHLQDQRRYDNCISRRNLYDGQFTLVRYLGREFQATPAQLAQGLEVLHDTLGPRPVCDQ